jgi:CheY-like chemotaxis protein
VSHKLRILTVSKSQLLADRLDELLKGRAIEVNRVPSGAGALILTGNLQYDLIVAGLPLPDLSLENFLAALRTIESCSTSTPALVVAPKEQLPSQLATHDLLRVLTDDFDQREMLEAVSGLLGVSARQHARTMVEIEVALDGSITTQLYQSENLSETGVLLRGARRIPVGSAVRFALTLPDEVEPVSGTAMVVRHTSAEEATLGIALQFAELTGDNLRRLRRFLAASVPGPSVLPGAGSGAAADQQRS